MLCKDLELPEFTYKDLLKKYGIPIGYIAKIASGELFPEISSKYNISNRINSRRKMYIDRDELIKDLLYEGKTCVQIAKELDMTLDAVYRRKAIMKKLGQLEDLKVQRLS